MRGAEKKTDASGVHIAEQFLACIVTACFLNELYLPFRDIMVFHELASYLTVNVPLVGFIRTEIGKDELCAFLVEIFIVCLLYTSDAADEL